jgi:hypothetical protein
LTVNHRKNPLEIFRRGVEPILKLTLKKYKDVDWINLVQYRHYRWPLVKTAVEQITISFSTRILLHGIAYLNVNLITVIVKIM